MKKNFTLLGVLLGYDLFEYLYYLFRTFLLKLKVNFYFSLESSETEFCLPYLLLVIKSYHKEILNININVRGNFHDINKQEKNNLSFLFQDPPQIIESAETAILKCKPEMDFFNYLNEKSTIKIKIYYDYYFLGKLYTAFYCSTWGLALKNNIQLSLILLSSER